MRTINKLLLAAAVAAPAVLASAPVQAQSVGVVSPEGAIANTNAWKTAQQQLQTTYKAQIDQARSRSQAIQAELNPLVQAFETARSAPNPNEAALRTQLQTIQTKEQAGNQEIQNLTAPYQRAQAYALEQIGAQMQAAVKAAADKKKLGVVVRPNDVLYLAPGADITADVTTELNRLTPSVGITPPAGWQPGGQGQQGAGAAAPAAAPAAQPKPAGR